jgi:fumarylpyruvate hydrolase
MSLIFELRPLPTAIVSKSGVRFPVGRIFCVGRNYAAHAREMGSDPNREPPFFFSKFPQALVPGGGTIPYPPKTTNFHYEAELVIAIGKEGAALDAKRALDIVYGYAVGLDMTRRDLQFEARDHGRPWDTGKNFAFAAPLGAIRPVEGNGHVDHGAIRLTVNGEIKQQGDLTDLIWSCAEVIAHLSQLERLWPGDLIYTGTPSGVGPVKPGDVIEANIDGLDSLRVTIGEREPEFRE